MSTSNHPFFSPGLQIPRFLFRGFNKYSGGGLPGQNTTEGITPRGFLLGYDTEKEISSSMDPWRVKARVESHCCHQDSPPTPFSSWSHDWRLALSFSLTRLTETKKTRCRLEEEDCGFIAVLDTWALQDESPWALNDGSALWNRVFNVPQFRIPHLNLPCEWLIWGPISGPSYRCVSFSTIRETINCSIWPIFPPWNQTETYLDGKDVQESMLVADCFQRSDDNSDDVMFAVAAAELGRRMWGPSYEIASDRDLETNPVLPIWPPNALETLLGVFALCNPVLSGRRLVLGHTFGVGFPCVCLMNTLLSKAEARWRDTDSDTSWAPVVWRQVLRKSDWWRENSCGFRVKGG